jgi:alkylation response protein AidB-like acyl-CoA dehydrogenase
MVGAAEHRRPSDVRERTLTPSTLDAATVAALAADGATEAEAQRRLDPEVIRAIVDAGFARYFVPAVWGGDADAARFTELLDAVVAIGARCPSTAWIASLTASLGRMASYLPDEGQAELWADGPDPLIVGALMPLGRAEPVDGGWRLRGQWPFVSAVDASDWALVCGMAGSEARFFAVPRADYAIEDTWFNVGMRATGSNTVSIDDVVVPAGRSFRRDDLAAGRSVSTHATATGHGVPLRAANGLSFAAPVLGAARGALQSWSGYVASKLAPPPARSGPGPGTGPGASDRSLYEVTLARSAGDIDAAQLLLERAAGLADQGPATDRIVAQNTRDCALAVDVLVTAVDRLFRTAGTSGQSATNALQRFWRDANVAATHVVLKFEPAASLYAQHHATVLGEGASPAPASPFAPIDQTRA